MEKYCDCGDHIERPKAGKGDAGRGDVKDVRRGDVKDAGKDAVHSLHTVFKKIDKMLRGVIIISSL